MKYKQYYAVALTRSMTAMTRIPLRPSMGSTSTTPTTITRDLMCSMPLNKYVLWWKEMANRPIVTFLTVVTLIVHLPVHTEDRSYLCTGVCTTITKMRPLSSKGYSVPMRDDLKLVISTSICFPSMSPPPALSLLKHHRGTQIAIPPIRY